MLPDANRLVYDALVAFQTDALDVDQYLLGAGESFFSA